MGMAPGARKLALARKIRDEVCRDSCFRASFARQACLANKGLEDTPRVIKTSQLLVQTHIFVVLFRPKRKDEMHGNPDFSRLVQGCSRAWRKQGSVLKTLQESRFQDNIAHAILASARGRGAYERHS